MEKEHKGTAFSLKKLILLFILLNCLVIGLCSVFVILLSNLNVKSSGVMGFFELGIVVLLPIAGIIAGFKIGDIYILVYNLFAGLFHRHKIDLNNGF